MRITKDATHLGNGVIQPEHAVEILCANCGYDLNARELAEDRCADCGEELHLRRNATVKVTTLPPMVGGVN
jgi:predicted RNA-binding Zn-ribbon protein involved in translation (DUF1610 family)